MGHGLALALRGLAQVVGVPRQAIVLLMVQLVERRWVQLEVHAAVTGFLSFLPPSCVFPDAMRRFPLLLRLGIGLCGTCRTGQRISDR